jgi:hypothetical protein
LKRGASQVRSLPVTSRLRSSTRQSSRFLPGSLQVRRLPGPPFGRTATGAVSRLENGWALSGLEGSTPSPSASRRHGRVERQRAATAQAAHRRSQVRVLLPPLFVPAWSSWQDARLLPARAQVRSLPPESHAPVVEVAMTPGPQPGSCGFEPRRGFHDRLLAVGELGTPPASGAGDRRFDSCRPDLRGRGAAVLASLMSSRPWVRIPPAHSSGA